MANATLQELLLPQVILRVISRVRSGQSALGRWLGFHPDRYDDDAVTLMGPNTIQGDTRFATFRIFDNTRVVAKGRAPGTGPATVARTPIGQTQIACGRFHEKVNLLCEELGNLSKITGPNAQIDQGGQDYITRQEKSLARKMNIAVEVMAAGMMRDSLYFQMVGDNWLPYLTQPSGVYFQVPFQIPAGNKNQLNMLGAGNIIDQSWANPAAPIMSHIAGIQMAYAQLHGYGLTDVWVNSGTWNTVLLNTQIRNTGGSSNVVFAEWDREPQTFEDGLEGNHFTGVLRAIPWLRWHICDDVAAFGTDVDPSYSTAPSGATLAKYIPDNMAIFSASPSSDWAQLYHGAEPVIENYGMPPVLRRGYYAWREYTTQPSALELITLLNAIPILYIPKIPAPATVIF